MRRVGATGDVVDEERIVGSGRVQVAQMLDRFVREIGGEVVVGLADKGKYLGVIAEEIRRPLVGLAAHKTVEVIETHPGWPLFERPGVAVLIGRRIVVLSKPRRRVAILLQY